MYKSPIVSATRNGAYQTVKLLCDRISEIDNDYEILGLTRDDAAGEAFDKIATLFGLPYPGGPEIDKLAIDGNPKADKVPRSMIKDKNYDFSFSGLKTSVRYFLAKEFPEAIPHKVLPDLCASVQQAIVDVLVKKSMDAVSNYKVRSIVIAGGVSANPGLRKKLSAEADKAGIKFIAPQSDYCMDNAAMIGFIAEKKLSDENHENFTDLTFKVSSSALRAEKKKRKKN